MNRAPISLNQAWSTADLFSSCQIPRPNDSGNEFHDTSRPLLFVMSSWVQQRRHMSGVVGPTLEFSMNGWRRTNFMIATANTVIASLHSVRWVHPSETNAKKNWTESHTEGSKGGRGDGIPLSLHFDVLAQFRLRFYWSFPFLAQSELPQARMVYLSSQNVISSLLLPHFCLPMVTHAQARHPCNILNENLMRIRFRTSDQNHHYLPSSHSSKYDSSSNSH